MALATFALCKGGWVCRWVVCYCIAVSWSVGGSGWMGRSVGAMCSFVKISPSKWKICSFRATTLRCRAFILFLS